MKVKQAQHGLNDSREKITQPLKEADECLTKSLDYVRTLMAELFPPHLHRLGLPAALRWLAQQMPRHGLEVAVDLDSEELPINEDQAKLLYQSVRELLINVVKHAAVNHASLFLEVDADKLYITVRDMGRGFTPSSMQPGAIGDQFGLSSVRDRMVLVGGQLTIESAPGHGTTAKLMMPLEECLPEIQLISTRTKVRRGGESSPYLRST